MPRKNYRNSQARRRHTSVFAEPEQSEYEVLMINEAGTRAKRIKIMATSVSTARIKAVRRGLRVDDESMPGVWTPADITRMEADWKNAVL